MRMIRAATIVAVVAMLDAAPLQATGYATPEAFSALYRDFPSGAGPQSIGSVLGEAIQGAGEHGPLVIVTGTALNVYDGQTRRLLAQADFRLGPASGFLEMTAVSHVGPAIAYLARLKELGDPRWSGLLDGLIAHLRAVRSENTTTSDHWLDRIDQPVFNPHKDAIRAMIDYACSMAGSYLVGVRQSGGEGFTTAAVASDFLSADSGSYPVPFNNVMVGTFILAALSGQYALHQALSGVEIDWPQARVVINAVAGTNYTAGLTSGTQPLVTFLRYLSGLTLPEDRILIAPYAALRPSIGAAELPKEEFDYYALEVWQQIHARRQIAPVAFPGVATLVLPERPALPGDHGVTAAGDIGGFMIRMRHSFADAREQLSNTVAFWTAGELHAKGWDPARVDLPGVTHGFPAGVSGYPSSNPAF